MNLVTEPQRVEAYRNAPEDIRERYISDTLIEHIDRLILLFEITKPYKEVSEIIGDTILGFYKIADMPRLFQQKLGVSADISQRMTSQLIEFLSPVMKREQEEVRAKEESKATLMQTFSAKSTDVPVGTAPFEESAKVTPIRTMEGDITRIHGYGAYRQAQGDQDEVTIPSSQNDLLDRK